MFLLAALTVLFLTNTGARADFNPVEWKNQQEIRLDKAGLLKFPLPLETLDAAPENLADLRVVDGKNNEIPYSVDRTTVEPLLISQAVKFETTLRDQSTVITCVTGIEQPIDSLWLETPSHDFIKAVRLEASKDGKTWKSLAEGQPIFRQPNGAANLHLSFPAGVWGRLRLTLDDRRAPPIPISNIQIQSAGKTASSEPFELTEVSRTESAGQTRIVLRAAGAHITLAELSIETPEPIFTRQVVLLTPQFSENEAHEVALARGTLFRIQMEGSPSVSNLGFAKEATLSSRDLILMIQNQDSHPLQVSKIKATRRPVNIVLSTSEAGPLRLMTGNARANAPRYDLASFSKNFSKIPIARVSIAPIQANPMWHPVEPLPEIPLTGSVIDIRKWKFRRPLKIKSTGIQELELDPELLSRTRSSFEDLRIVTDGKQAPYVLERTSLLRSLNPVMEAADDPKQPKISRWLLKLSHPSLPISQLRCTVSNSIFKRDVQLVEEITDERGILHRQEVGRATWVRTAGQNKMQLMIVLNRLLLTDRLFLEVNNGDNPPLQLSDFEVWYTATRLLFKASPGSEMHLYYGNPNIQSPQYDIGLVAGQILSAEKTTASLEKEERLGKPTLGENSIVKSTAGALFWIVLVVVVGALLVVMARLLPKSASEK